MTLSYWHCPKIIVKWKCSVSTLYNMVATGHMLATEHTKMWLIATGELIFQFYLFTKQSHVTSGYHTVKDSTIVFHPLDVTIFSEHKTLESDMYFLNYKIPYCVSIFPSVQNRGNIYTINLHVGVHTYTELCVRTHHKLSLGESFLWKKMGNQGSQNRECS